MTDQPTDQAALPDSVPAPHLPAHLAWLTDVRLRTAVRPEYGADGILESYVFDVAMTAAWVPNNDMFVLSHKFSAMQMTLSINPDSVVLDAVQRAAVMILSVLQETRAKMDAMKPTVIATPSLIVMP